MASTSQEKVGPLDVTPPPKSVLPSFLSPVTNVYDRFAQWRSSLGLSYPGNVESLQKEVKATHLTNYIFDGARADLTKALSVTPAFQVTHSFSLASQTALPSYNFGAIFANSKVFMQGGVDHEGTVNGRFNAGWNDKNVTKAQLQLSQQHGASMIQMEHDYQGADYSLNVKALNPSPVDASGIFIGSYLQSITPNLALGSEVLYQRGGPMEIPAAPSYLAKYMSSDKSWIATAQLQPMGMLSATYWQKLSEKVEAAADLQVVVANGKREGVATLGAKYDLRMATFRAQLDSTGKVSAMLEQRFAPTFAFMVAGEIDHFKNAAKIGVGVMIESSSLTPEEMGLVPPPGYPPPAPYP
ncbi:eukaryotic porin-domain-containing protein [Phellopilus nigrolimitatus]|nr:eukaryotic porin-domain-containing protein [Phellopilus nigrolimitatus]